MAATPTAAEVLEIRGDLQTYIDEINALSGGAKDVGDYTDRSLAQLMRDLDNKRSVEWSQVYVDPDYLGDGRNESNCKNMISILAIAYVFEDYFLKTAGDNYWYDVYQHYFGLYESEFKSAKLDIDLDDSGTIEPGEEGRSGQTFLVR